MAVDLYALRERVADAGVEPEVLQMLVQGGQLNGRGPRPPTPPRRLGVAPAYASWEGLATYCGMSVRWLKEKVPLHLRLNPGGGKILVRLSDFDAWFETFRQDRDLAAIEEELAK